MCTVVVVNVLKLKEIDKNARDVGVKAAYLGELTKLGLPVPEGFVVTADGFEKFLVFNRIDEKIREFFSSVNWDNHSDVTDKSKEIRELIINSPLPSQIEKNIIDEYEEMSVGRDLRGLGGVAFDMIRAGRTPVFCAVRTSLLNNTEYSFAGQTETHLNVNGNRTLLEAIKKCWASLFSLSALYYRRRAGIEEQPKAGVVVQKMVNSEKSGSVLLTHPFSEGNLLLESVWGLGETIGLGEVIPDSYAINSSGNITEKRIGKKTIYRTKHGMSGKTVSDFVSRDKITAEVLAQDEIAKVIDLARKVETGIGSGFGLEFGIEKGKVFILQARPLVNKKIYNQFTNTEGKKVIASGMPLSYGIIEGQIASNFDSPEAGILVTKQSSPGFGDLIGRLLGIVSEAGGLTGHAAVIAREFSIPFVSAVENATSIFRSGQEIVLDAIKGRILSQEIEQAYQEIAGPTGISESALGVAGLTATEIKISYPFSGVSDIDGVGLVRGESLVLDSERNPFYLAETNPEELTEAIKQKLGEIARAVYPKPVWYRLIDIKTDEFRLAGSEEEQGTPSATVLADLDKLDKVGMHSWDSPLARKERETNPMLGWHGIRRSLDQPEILQAEIEAIRRLADEGLNNIGIMLAFVTKVEEIKRFREYLDFPAKLGVSIESPASVFIIEDLCKEGVDFVSIGSNELTQFILAADRDNANTSKYYSEMDPAVINAIKRVIGACRKHRIHSSLYGDAANNPQLASMLVEFGISSISASPAAIEDVRKAVVRTERKLLIEMLRNR